MEDQRLFEANQRRFHIKISHTMPGFLTNDMSESLVRILHELPELSVDFTSAAWMCCQIRRQTGSSILCTFLYT